MKKRFSKSISLMLTLILLLGIFPISALAANDEDVLSSISHTLAVSVAVNSESNSITMTVPYTYTGESVVLSSGLDITYDTSVYSSASASFPNGATAVIGGAAIMMVITYQRKDSTSLNTTNYSVNVVKAAQTSSTFSGTILKTASLPNTIVFTSADFSEKYVENEGEALTAIVITGSDPSFGYLKLGSSSALGTTVTLADLQDGRLTFVPNNTGTVSYTVSAYSSGSEAQIGNAVLTITVQEASGADNIVYTSQKNTLVSFKNSDFSAVCTAVTGGVLSYIKFTLPAATYGKLYYNYRTSTDYDSLVSSETAYFNNASPYLSNVDFIPAANLTGNVSILYTAYDIVGNSYSGKIIIRVKDTTPNKITYITNENNLVSFKASDFNKVCAQVTGDPLSYVSFTLPDTTSGKLYYNYRSSTDYDYPVAVDTKFYNSAEPSLSNVDFIPAADFTGTAKIQYTAYSTYNISFSSEIIVIVGEKEDSGHFHDVGKNLSWAAEAIDYLYEQGILKGDGAGYYNPHASISKGDFVLMLCRAFDLETEFSDNFSDVNKDDYYYNAVGVAKKRGIAKGSNGKFNPRSALSRQDAVVLIARALEAAGIDLPTGADSDILPFKDKHKISDYAENAFKALVKAGIIKGSDKFLNPNSSVSRAEIAVILYRVLTM